MTDAGRVMGLDVARALAGRFVGLIAPYAERILVVGSIRRGREQVHDVDLLAIPKFEKKKDWFGGLVEVNLLTTEVDRLIEAKVVEARKKKNGTTMVGKGVAFLEFEGYPVDLYYASEETWFGLMQIRTGSAAFNQSIASKALHDGRRLHADGYGVSDETGRRLDDGKSEESIFAALRMRYYRPDEREILSGEKP